MADLEMDVQNDAEEVEADDDVEDAEAALEPTAKRQKHVYALHGLGCSLH